MKKSLPLNRQEGLVVQELNGEVLIYDIKENKALCLNETSALVWRLCDGENSVTDISQSIGKKLNSPANEDLVWLALDQLKKENLIANSEEVVPNYNGLSRREVIKKVGLGTMIALPLVSSLIAPVAANAASGGTVTETLATCTAATGTCTAGTSCSSATCPNGTGGTVAVTACVCGSVAVGTTPVGGVQVNVFACVAAVVCITTTFTDGRAAVLNTRAAVNGML